MEARNRSLPEWFSRIRSRQLLLPRFQRFEAWTYRNVTGLLDTVLRGLPAGALLILEIGDEEPFVSRPMKGGPSEGDRVSEHLLDGQQRLTALWRSLTGDYEDRSFFVDLSPPEEGEADESGGGPTPRTVSFARWTRNGKRYPRWVDDPAQTWGRSMIPVELLRPDGEAEQTFKAWAAAATGRVPEAMMELYEQGTSLRNRFALFNLPFLSLPASTPAETALDVFVKMNTSAQPLSTYDIVVAQVEAGTGVSLHDRVEDLRQHAPLLEHFGDPADILLDAAAFLQDKPARRGVMLGDQFADRLIEDWDRLLTGARRAAAFLDEESIFDSARLPTDPLVPLLVALWSHAPDGWDQEGEARLLLRRYLWRGLLTDRYERASNTRAVADYRAIRELLDGRDAQPPQIFDDEFHAPPAMEEIRTAGWPKNKERLARAILLIALRNGGMDIADASPATRETLQHREYHHLFPVAYLKERDYGDSDIFRALNCALVTWRTNRKIAAKDPATYIRERAEASKLGEDEIRRRLATHLIDLDMLTAGNYEGFLDSRAEMIRDVADGLCR
jgi:hypothetical protein